MMMTPQELEEWLAAQEVVDTQSAGRVRAAMGRAVLSWRAKNRSRDDVAAAAHVAGEVQMIAETNWAWRTQQQRKIPRDRNTAA
jgi:hypothetical protein